MQLSNGISQLVNSICTVLRSIAMMPADAGYFNTIFGIALSLGYNAPVRTGHIHDNGKIRLLRKFCHNLFCSFGAALFFTVSIINYFFKIIKACSLQGLQTINNFYYRGLIIADAGTPGKTVFIYAEGALSRFAAIKYRIHMSH